MSTLAEGVVQRLVKNVSVPYEAGSLSGASVAFPLRVPVPESPPNDFFTSQILNTTFALRGPPAF
jgi:hypothetical protein